MLQTARLALVPMTAADLDPLVAIYNEPGVRRYLWDDQPVTREQALGVVQASVALFRDYGFGLFTIWKDGVPLGCCGLRFWADTDEIELLYCVSERWWNQGIATEAARECLRYGLYGLKLDRVVAFANPANEASWRVLEKIGMRFERAVTHNNEPLKRYSVKRNPS